MLEQFDQRTELIVRQCLRDYDDKIAELEARLEEQARRTRNIIQPAKISQIHDSKQKVKVAYGRNESPWLKWFSSMQGQMREYRCPTVGEQCVLVNYGGGDNSTQAWVLCGVWCDEFPLPDNRPHVHTLDWGGGIRLEVDTSAGTVDWWVPTKTTFHTPMLHGTEHVRDFKRMMQGDRDIYNVHTHKATPPPSPQK
ncbi:MAG: phage baseplate assembly protein V [Marinobacterium sp.]|nr:phage baseplate assembly protein V [Marinobacterium sp.]